MNRLTLRTILNIGYNTLSKMILFGLAMVINIVLAQNLDSSDYGLIGFVMIWIGFLSQFSDIGITPAVVQKDRLDDEGLYTAFTMKVILGLSIFSLSLLFSPFSLYLFDHPAVQHVIIILSANLVINSFGFLPSSLLTRNLHYKRYILPQVGASLINAILTISLALNGYKYWSIVVGSIGSAIANVILLNIVQPTPLHFRFDKKSAAHLLHFGSHIFYNGLIIFMLLNADNFIIGTVAGPQMLGYYSLAFTWGSMVCTVLAETVHTVLFPTFSKLQNDRDSIKHAYLKSLDYSAFIGIIANLALFVFAEEFLFFVLGRGTGKWLAALPILRILCIYGMIRSILEPVGNVVMAIGKPKLISTANLIAGTVQILLLYPVLIAWGIEGVAALITISYTLQYVVYFPYLRKHFHLPYHDVWKAVAPSIASAFATLLVSFLFFEWVSLTATVLFIKLLFLFVSYLFIYGILTHWRFISDLQDIIHGLTKGR